MTKYRLTLGSVFEIELDKFSNKGYIIYVAKHIPIGFKLFALYGVKPRKEGYKLEELKNIPIIGNVLVFPDDDWKKIGNIKLTEPYKWPDQYEHDLNDNKKIIVYHWGDGEKKKILKVLEDKDKLDNIDIGYTLFPKALKKYYIEKLKKFSLYNYSNSIDDVDYKINPMDFSGVYGKVYYFCKNLLKENVALKNVEDSALKKFKIELYTPDTALQFYMGLAKAALEYKQMSETIKAAFLKKFTEEKDYLEKEEWLKNEADELLKELKVQN